MKSKERKERPIAEIMQRTIEALGEHCVEVALTEDTAIETNGFLLIAGKLEFPGLATKIPTRCLILQRDTKIKDNGFRCMVVSRKDRGE